jgi:hypothetical protein
VVFAGILYNGTLLSEREYMLKFTGVAKVGDIIRAYDFKPMAGRDDAFIEGIVIDADNMEGGYKAFKIEVTADKFKKYETKAKKTNRVGALMYVPHETGFMEFDFRVINLSKV